MLDRGRFWTPAPTEGQAQFTARGVDAKFVAGLSQALLSGPQRFGAGRLAGFAAPVGFSGVASGPRYAVAIARDRSLIVSEGAIALAEGWDAESATAVTRMDDAFVVLDLEGPGLADLLSKATTLDFADASPSAALAFAGLPCLAYRYARSDVLRLHVERPLACALAEWMRLA
jgi:sarcosine oxidase gamma subunit